MAKKYIDADRLKAEIERRKEEYKKDRYMSDYRGQIAYYKDEIYDDLLSFIDSLQQEQPSEDLEEAARLYSIPHYMKDIDVNYIEEYPYDSGLEAAFIAGAEWMKKQMPMPEDTVIFQKGIEEGKRLMMEDAVEGYVNYYEDSGGILMAEAQVGCPYHNGDRVKIVIVKED